MKPKPEHWIISVICVLLFFISIIALLAIGELYATHYRGSSGPARSLERQTQQAEEQAVGGKDGPRDEEVRPR